MKVDFHVHSTASDGTVDPSDLSSMGSGFTAMAITDHDNCDGVADFLQAGGATGTMRFAGVEISIEPGAGFDKFHLLAINVDPSNARLKGLLRRILSGRNERNRRILANFSAIGIEIPEQEIAAYAHGEVLARPHFARWLSDHGYADGVSDAFERFLMPDSPRCSRCYEDRWHPDQEDAFGAVHAAGGIAIMAHPRYWRSSWRRTGCDFTAAERELARLSECGLDGVECLYQANTQEENVNFSMMAERLGLLKSAGSDFHGANKPLIPLGMEVSEDFIAPLLERLRCFR